MCEGLQGIIDDAIQEEKKKVEEEKKKAVKEKNLEAAQAQLKTTMADLDKCSSKGLIKKN